MLGKGALQRGCDAILEAQGVRHRPMCWRDASEHAVQPAVVVVVVAVVAVVVVVVPVVVVVVVVIFVSTKSQGDCDGRKGSSSPGE